jgi:hypothetical protein
VRRGQVGDDGYARPPAPRIDRALAWDAAHVDPYAPKGAAREEVVNGLRAMKAQVLATADDIRKRRAANGLENR